MSSQQNQLDYISRYLIYKLLKYFGPDAALISQRIESSNGLDGFMSALYTVQLDMKVNGNDKQETMLVKFMKGSPEFRKDSKSYIQFANEVLVYAELLPAYEHLLRSSNLNTDLVEGFVPRCYFAQFGQIEGMGEANESVLALQHLKPAGYELGPRLTLRRDQLEAMCNVLGPYHALGYATRILQPQVHERLKNSIKELPFVYPSGTTNLYEALYRVAFDRFYEYYDRQRAQLQPEEDFAAAVERLRAKYFAQPEHILEGVRINASGDKFSTFLHGDFNRNNVLFHEDAAGRVDNIKMIDFQELRYGTTAIDISFFLYINTAAAEREQLFPRLLQLYYKRMYEQLELLLQRNTPKLLDEEQLQVELEHYSFQRFEEHFKKYAFYGVMICMHFLPWLLGTEEDCERLSKLFEQDMYGAEFHQLSMQIAGDEANVQIYNIMHHAFKQGYMDAVFGFQV
ncbi:CG5126 [Drosophila busckii]|uniref:CG5126 n=1 Tax=Drosophila busckii TaxID=30019 RepID=A0A0M4FAC3_DROBS|nr:uncharacterized protein LOC108606255 [Drosophila busckii]ALC49332.1 CG5126 [Drosophila busckii]